MRRLLLLAVISFITLSTYAQVKFEPGYFINNDGNKIECLIRNADRATNNEQRPSNIL